VEISANWGVRTIPGVRVDLKNSINLQKLHRKAVASGLIEGKPRGYVPLASLRYG
jgi:hypothetical protein